MAAVDSPSATLSNNSAAAQFALERLDELYVSYLERLHLYTEARTRLGKEMSDAFFALAQANFSTQNRIRYGQDHYDERMHSNKRIHVETDDKQAFTFDVARAVEEPTSTAEPTDSECSVADEVNSAEMVDERKEATTDLKTQLQDPLRWFGILVPQSLRESQKHFSKSVRLIVEAVVTHDSHLQAIEIEIRRTRKQLSKLQ